MQHDRPQSNEHSEATKKAPRDERTAREKKQAEQRDAMAGVKPTPTQEENDLAASGEHVTEHEADGSPPDPSVMAAPSQLGSQHAPGRSQAAGDSRNAATIRPGTARSCDA